MPTPKAENDARNTELEWNPSPPKEWLSWACCQAASVTSAARQAEKQDLVSPSKARIIIIYMHFGHLMVCLRLYIFVMYLLQTAYLLIHSTCTFCCTWCVENLSFPQI